MRATVDREEALRLLKIEHQAVAALIAELTDEEMTRRDTIQHGERNADFVFLVALHRRREKS